MAREKKAEPAEVQKEKVEIVTVAAGTFPETGGGFAKAKVEKLMAAGLQGFHIRNSKDKGYICVAKEVEGREKAKELITEAEKKGIRLAILA